LGWDLVQFFAALFVFIVGTVACIGSAGFGCVAVFFLIGAALAEWISVKSRQPLEPGGLAGTCPD
jgi:hypothetical protein